MHIVIGESVLFYYNISIIFITSTIISQFQVRQSRNTRGQSHIPEIPQSHSHKHASHSNCPPLTIDQSPPSCTFQTHALTLWWLCWPLTWGEGACCLMVWIHSLCVKSFPASGTVRGQKRLCWVTSEEGTLVEGGRTQQGKESIV